MAKAVEVIGTVIVAKVTRAILNRINATRIIYFLYQLVQIAVSPAVALYLLYRGLRDARYFKGMTERLGFLPDSIQPTGTGTIWFHAVSVGEVLSLGELLRRLHADRPRVQFYVTTATLAGRAMAEQKLAGLVHGVAYAPFDYRSIVRRFLWRLRPSLVVVMETEIWPNLYRETKRSGASLLVLNGRISDRAGPTYSRLRWFFLHVLCWPDAILTQSAEDEGRYVAAGAPPAKVFDAGNLKYDFVPPKAGIAADLVAFLNGLAPAKIWIAASTMPAVASGAALDVDEDDAVIHAFRDLAIAHPKLLLILVPRKPERFAVAAEKLAHAQIPFVRRSGLAHSFLPLPGVLLLDSMGELAALFQRADVVFMGGTLADRGGHNILEPAYFGKPIIVGPHMENFTAIAQEFRNAEATLRIASADELAPRIQRLLADPVTAEQIGERARTLAQSKRGIAEKMAVQVWRAFDEGVPQPMHTLMARIFLRPLSWIWRIGSRVKMERGIRQRRSLQAPVISIGGLSMGGAGKTPLVTHLASRFHEMGRNPAILTRGFKRKSAQPIVLVKRGMAATLDLTGDEAQLFIRSGHAHIGIARDRFKAGTKIEKRMSPDVFLLDDGFQHQKLARKHDVVLIDALDPFAGGVFPLGRSREPAVALRRATAIVLTRSDLDHPNLGLERKLREINPSIPIFRSRVVPLEWVNLASGQAIALDKLFRKCSAFCGLGNPRSFWATLDELKLDVKYKWDFGDHHSYRPAELTRFAQQAKAAGAQAIVTTEKDAVNLPEQAVSIVDPLPLFWLRIGLQIDREEELLRLLS